LASKLTAAILSILIPGLGQFYAGQAVRGLIVFVLCVAIGLASGGILAIPAWIIAAWDAYRIAA